MNMSVVQHGTGCMYSATEPNVNEHVCCGNNKLGVITVWMQ